MRRRHVFVALMLWGAQAIAGTPLPDGPHVVAQGSAKVEVAPDSAKLTLLFSHRAGSAIAAKQAVDAAVNRYLDTLQQFGIAPRDIEAGDVDVSQVDEDDEDRPRTRAPGFEAERRVTVVLGEVARLDALMDAGLRDGATEVISLDFQLRDGTAVRREAKRKAIADARERAGDAADAVGATLGPAYSIDTVRSLESDGYRARELDRIEVSGGSKARPGQYLRPLITVSESVSVVYELRR